MRPRMAAPNVSFISTKLVLLTINIESVEAFTSKIGLYVEMYKLSDEIISYMLNCNVTRTLTLVYRRGWLPPP